MVTAIAIARLLAVGGCIGLQAHGQTISNTPVMIDMVQNNPGDPVGWEQTKYFDPKELIKLNYTGMTTTGEMSGTQAVDFHTLGQDFFPAGSAQRLWLDAYAKGVDRFIKRAKGDGIKAYFFVDLLVFPTPVLAAWQNATTGDGKTVAWNDATRQLLKVLVQETFARFPGCDGWIVRTGETYTYDTPYHVGNTPNKGKTSEIWVDFIKFLRDEVCAGQGKDLFFRGWDNWPSNANYYQQMTDQIEPHPQLYFSIKHSAGDFTRPAQWNPQLGVGKHAQIVEVELQREYEGKASYPNYVMNGVIDGFPEMSNPIGLKDIVKKPQLKGLWTWTRGGGWWGPYIHGNEQWVDLHARVLAKWWTSQQTALRLEEVGVSTGFALTEAEAFADVCPGLLPGCTGDCCAAFRNFSLTAADAVLKGQWGTVGGGTGDSFMRDDRMGDVTHHLMNSAIRGPAVDEKADALALQHRNNELWSSEIKPHLTDDVLADKIDASVQYLYEVIYAAWRVMAQGAAYTNRAKDPAAFNKTELADGILAYDAAWAAYRAYGLAEFYAPSLYHPYYLCLGIQCNCAFDPPAADLKNSLSGGIGAAVDALRNVSGLPPPPGPPQPESGGEKCQNFTGFNCYQGQYCEDVTSGAMTDYAHSGTEDIKACAALCTASKSCTCFIHTDRPDPGGGFAACKTVNHTVTKLASTARGYSAYVKAK